MEGDGIDHAILTFQPRVQPLIISLAGIRFTLVEHFWVGSNRKDAVAVRRPAL